MEVRGQSHQDSEGQGSEPPGLRRSEGQVSEPPELRRIGKESHQVEGGALAIWRVVEECLPFQSHTAQ